MLMPQRHHGNSVDDPLGIVGEEAVIQRERNWAGNHTYRASRFHQPASLDELRRIVSAATRVRALGSRHAFNDIADSTELVSLDRLPQKAAIDSSSGTVTVTAGMTYGALAQVLHHEGVALHNMASLPHISIAGAIATATHGSGDANGNLATAVSALELVTHDGDIVHVSRTDDDFAGIVVGLGALGIVTRITLDLQPGYQMRQQVFEHLDWDVLYDRFDDVMAGADSVSLFTDFGETVDQVWLKTRVDREPADPLPDEFLGAAVAVVPLHPVGSLSPDNCTGQLGVPGAWHDRLPHFRMDAIPASGDEIQAEYMLPRRHAVAALQAIRERASEIQQHLWISEIRTVRADDLWMSTAYGTDTVCIHFSWRFDPPAVDRVLPVVEAALAPYGPRPHWGKVFAMGPAELGARYQRLADFRRLATSMDSRGAFRNDFLDRYVFDGG
ncbi:MAG: FAD-binding protein [Chloroflexota bacterium]|nr:FAD-binding protein [Chloroflexota bacterium]